MKRLTNIFILLIMFSLIGAVNAQKIQVGTIGGLNFADLDSDIFEFEEGIAIDISKITVYGIGGLVDIHLYKNLFLHLEPMYLQRGGMVETDLAPIVSEDIPINLTSSGIDLTFKTSYLEIPILLKAEFGDRIRPYFIAGPTIGFLIRSDLIVNVLGLGLNLDLNDVTESINYGLTFGSGLRIPVDSFSIFVEGRYTMGMADIFKEGTLKLGEGPVLIEELDVENDKFMKTRGFQIMMGLSVPLN